MINERIAQLEASVNSAENLSSEARAELLRLIADLRAEVPPAAAPGAPLQPGSEETVDSAFRELSSSVAEFEASHPRLVQVVDRIALTLSNMGI